jgi:hypothetical protein
MLTFKKPRQFLLERMKPQANYPPFKIKTLLEKGGGNGRSTNDKTTSRLPKFNPKEAAEREFKSVPIHFVLESHEIVLKEDGDNSYVLDTHSFTNKRSAAEN